MEVSAYFTPSSFYIFSYFLLILARLIQQIQAEAARAPTLLEEWRERAMAQAGRASPYPT
jgi:hypothetical protein